MKVKILAYFNSGSDLFFIYVWENEITRRHNAGVAPCPQSSRGSPGRCREQYPLGGRQGLLPIPSPTIHAVWQGKTVLVYCSTPATTCSEPVNRG